MYYSSLEKRKNIYCASTMCWMLDSYRRHLISCNAFQKPRVKVELLPFYGEEKLNHHVTVRKLESCRRSSISPQSPCSFMCKAMLDICGPWAKECTSWSDHAPAVLFHRHYRSGGGVGTWPHIPGSPSPPSPHICMTGLQEPDSEKNKNTTWNGTKQESVKWPSILGCQSHLNFCWGGINVKLFPS